MENIACLTYRTEEKCYCDIFQLVNQFLWFLVLFIDFSDICYYFIHFIPKLCYVRIRLAFLACVLADREKQNAVSSQTNWLETRWRSKYSASKSACVRIHGRPRTLFSRYPKQKRSVATITLFYFSKASLKIQFEHTWSSVEIFYGKAAFIGPVITIILLGVSVSLSYTCLRCVFRCLSAQ